MHQRAVSTLLFAVLFAAALAATAPETASAQTNLTSPGGQVFTFSTDGSLMSPPTSPFPLYSPGYQLQVNGSTYFGGSPVTSADGRTLTFPAATIGGLNVQRIVYVPDTGTHDFARYLDVLTNSGGTAMPATVTIATTMDSFFAPLTVSGSSSGDTVVTTDDDWMTLNPGASPFGGANPLVGAVLQGPSAMARTATETGGSGGGPFGGSGANWTFSVNVPGAGGRVAILTFALQKALTDMTGMMADETYLVSTPDDVMVGIDSYLDAIVNFQEDTPGAPRIRFMGASMASEGDAIDMTVAVTDPAGGTPTWTWDLNGDGVFGDMPGATSYTVPAGSTDGPTTVRVGVEAMNGTATSQRYHTIQIQNVAPIIAPPAPPNTTTNGANFGYQIMASDPAGTLDPLHFACTMCPGSMTVTDTGFVTWSPSDMDVTMPMMPHHVAITVDDGDMGTTQVTWDLTVLSDHPPSRPTAIYPSGIAVLDPMPRIVAGNSTDEDGDPLTYVFEVDTVDTFDSPAKLTSDPVPQTDGYTAWRPLTPLDMGTQYYWRVRANDGMVDGDWAMAFFYTSGTPAARDAGPAADAGPHDGSTPTDGGHVVPPSRGCCATAPGAPGSPVVLALGIVALVIRRKRRV